MDHKELQFAFPQRLNFDPSQYGCSLPAGFGAVDKSSSAKARALLAEGSPALAFASCHSA
jgi:hypothetical protein